MAEKRVVSIEDLYELKSVTDPRLAPNGKDCVFVQTVMLEKENDYSSNIYYLNLDNKQNPVQWTFGECRNHSPRWSPDGSRLAFVSNRSGKNQIYILNVNGGEAQQATFCRNGASNPVWSPEGSRLAFSVALGNGDSLHDRADSEKKKEDQLVPLEVDKMKYKSDAHGFWNGKYTQAAIVDLESGEKELLTDGRTDYALHGWSPDGKQLAVTADVSEDPDFAFQNDVLLIHTETKEMTRLTEGTGYFGNAAWSPNGKFIGMIGHEREFENATLAKVWIYSFEDNSLRCLTADSDIMAGDVAIGDFQQGAVAPGILWGDDNHSFYFLATDHGNTVVYYGNVNGEIYPALLEKQHVYGLTIDGKNERAVAAISKPAEPGELFSLNISTGEKERLTHVNEAFLSGITLSEPESIEFKAADGTKLHGWLMRPANFKDGEKYPLILEIHGGPHAMYANSYFHEFQTLAAQDYAVLYINPRGSHGYGQNFVDAVRGDYGGNDYQDLMDAVDYALENYSFIDQDRLGVTGGSYGGFMTNWIVGHTNRFKAAVTQRSISNWISFYGVSDIGYYFTEWQIKADLKDIQTLWKHSPLAYASQINTPLLILHSEKDFRCPIEQAEQLFIALKRQKKQTKFIRFPEANHELSRSGKPSLRIKRLNYILEWFKQYI